MNERRVRPMPWGPLGLLAGAAVLLAALAWAAAPPQPKTPVPLAAMLPQGALMSVESADFSSLVADWNRSPEQRAWLNSADYSAFANSRLFTRLADAQTGFADAARTGVNGEFLKQIAGRESIFAWYDLHDLTFLYISHLPPDQLSGLSLLAQRGSFARREAAGTAFYVRTSAGRAASGDETSPEADTSEQPRTVAFAVRGEWLLLATREDLLASALQLMAGAQGAGPQVTGAPAESLATAGWYAAANAASAEPHGDLHMVLDLQALTRTPQFRSYWIQRNVTATRQFRAAVVDLYREPDQFREERVLLPVQPTARSDGQPDLGALAQMVPDRAGVYRAVAHPGAEDALGALEDKVLVREPARAALGTSSPAGETAAAPVGAAGDYDTRIDAPKPREAQPGDEFTALRRALGAPGMDSLLTVDRSDPPTASNAFVSLHSAVALHALSPWNKDVLAAAILASLRPRLTAASLGVGWAERSFAGRTYRTLGAGDPVCLWVDGPLAILTTDPAMMEDMLKRGADSRAAAQPASLIAGFRHDQERRDFRLLMADLNLPSGDTSESAPRDRSAVEASPPAPTPVDLFRDNLPSLSDAFQALASERFTETSNGRQTHQTVLYRWNAANAKSDSSSPR